MDILEIEVKSYCRDHEGVIRKLESEGAEFIGLYREVDLYFNHPAKDFIKTDEVFRIRRINGDTVITYKGPKIGDRSKARVEEEVAVADYETAKKIFLLLGFAESGAVVKRRKKYKLNDIEVCVDSVEGLGDFIELEKRDSDRVKVESELFSLAEKLGLDQFERRSYLELLKIKAQ